MANFHRSSRPTKRDYFGFSFITVLCIISIQVVLCSARPNLDDSTEQKSDNGVSKSLKELPLIEEEEEKLEAGSNDGEQDEPEEIEDPDYDGEDTGDTIQTPKKYSEPRETSSTSSTITPNIIHLFAKTESEYMNEDKNADESQTKSTTMVVEPPSNVNSGADTITTSNGLIQKNYFFVLFIPVLSYFLI